MKKLLAIAAAALTALLGFAPEAEAGRISIGFTSYYNHGHASCGCSNRFKKIFRGYDRYRAPIWNVYSLPIRHRCSYGHSRSNNYYGNGGFVQRNHYNARSDYRRRAGDGFRHNRRHSRRSSRRSYSSGGGYYCR